MASADAFNDLHLSKPSSHIDSFRMLRQQPVEELVDADSPLSWLLQWLKDVEATNTDSWAFLEDRNISTSTLRDPAELSPQPSTLSSPQERVVSCHICLEDIPEHDILSIPLCDHSFCRECLLLYVTGKLKERRYPINCPTCVMMDRTDIYVTEAIVQQLELSEDDMERLIESQIQVHAIVIDCNRCKQAMHVDRQEYLTQDVIECPMPDCENQWCKFCRKEVTSCDTTHRCKSWKLDKLIWRKGWKSCPGCGILVERTSGCNHMTCAAPGCFVHFCYKCGRLIIDSTLGGHVGTAVLAHYSHCRQYERRFIPRRIRRVCTIQ